jgi:glycosyltransferase involved in cell wall biosynthesis
MAARKAIVAARASAVPEVVRSGILVEPDQHEPLADAIRHLYRNPELRKAIAIAGSSDVEQFDMDHVAARFVSEISHVVPALDNKESGAPGSLDNQSPQRPG